MRSIVLSIDTQPRLDSTTNLVRYRRHKPEETSLYPIIEQHLPQFLGQIAEHGTHLPRFVTQEFDEPIVPWLRFPGQKDSSGCSK